MKLVVASLFGLLISCTSFASETLVKFIEIDGYHEHDGLPPVLEARFSLACNQTFLKLVRHESTDPETNKVIISLGGLVEQTLDECNADEHHLSVWAGNSYSGREYEVRSIKR